MEETKKPREPKYKETLGKALIVLDGMVPELSTQAYSLLLRIGQVGIAQVMLSVSQKLLDEHLGKRGAKIGKSLLDAQVLVYLNAIEENVLAQRDLRELTDVDDEGDINVDFVSRHALALLKRTHTSLETEGGLQAQQMFLLCENFLDVVKDIIENLEGAETMDEDVRCCLEGAVQQCRPERTA